MALLLDYSSAVENVTSIKDLDIGQVPPGEMRYFWLHIVNNPLGEAVRIPLMVARGKKRGPVLGLTAAVHGNELNGIPVIHKIFQRLPMEDLAGTIIGVPGVNTPGMIREQRFFNDGTDLNRIAPGKPDGNISQIYIHRFMERVLKKFELLIDLHTASTGRVNSLYVRADMKNPTSGRMAQLQNAQIIVQNKANDGSLRGAAVARGCPAITVELCDPLTYQPEAIDSGVIGVTNVLYDLKMLPGEIVCPVTKTILCDTSYWIYTDEGGMLRILPNVCDYLKKGDEIARVTTIFGVRTKQYFAPEDGVVIGKSTNPLNQTGSRILHLGVRPQEIDCLVS